MTRLIDADALKDWSEIVPLTCDGGIDINDFDEKLKSMPTVDAVPVVRCKDCKNRYSSCPMITIHPTGSIIFRAQDDWFCFMGERKEE